MTEFETKVWTLKEVAQFAAHAHEGQKRKYTGKPYLSHCAEVALLVQRHVSTQPVVVAAAWLHDVVEDTSFSLKDIESRFGTEVSALVDELTDKATLDMGNRKTRKDFECRRLSSVSKTAKHIKLADILSNSISIVANDPKFAQTYLHEKALLLTRALYFPQHTLWRQGANLINRYITEQHPAWWDTWSDSEKSKINEPV